MHNKFLRLFALIFLFYTADSEAALRIAYLKSRPVEKLGTRVSENNYAWTENQLTVPLRIAVGEGEGIMVFVDPSQRNAQISVEYSSLSEKGIMLDVFYAEYVTMENGQRVPDPLIPLSSGQGMAFSGAHLVYIRASALYSARPASFTIPLVFYDRSSREKITLNFKVEVLPVHLPSSTRTTIQATVWTSKWFEEKGNGKIAYDVRRMKQLLKLLSGYGINALSGMWPMDLKEYNELVVYALEDLNFNLICLPAKQVLAPWGDLNSLKAYLRKRPDEKTLVEETRRHLKQFEPLRGNSEMRGRFALWLWDEPVKEYYPDVLFSYRAARMAGPDLKLELTAEPSLGLGNAADIWIPYVKNLKPYDVEEQHHLGKKVWMYANKVHGIDHPLYGMRILGWVLWKYNLDGYLFWAVNWWKVDPWRTLSSDNKDFMKRGTLVYLDPATGRIYPSLRLMAFLDGMEDMLLLKELEKMDSKPVARALLGKLRDVYGLAERYDSSPDPLVFREEILDVLKR